MGHSGVPVKFDWKDKVKIATGMKVGLTLDKSNKIAYISDKK
jgi:hypothetical protein